MILKTLSSLGLLGEGFAPFPVPAPVRSHDSEARLKEVLLKERDRLLEQK